MCFIVENSMQRSLKVRQTRHNRMRERSSWVHDMSFTAKTVVIQIINVSIFKFAFEMIRQSWPINRFDFHRRGLL